MKILSFNVRNWHRDRDKSSDAYWLNRAKEIKAMLAKENPDVICLQENIPPMSWIIIPKGYRKVGISYEHDIYVRKGIKHSPFVKMRYCWSKATIDGIDIFNVHAYWKEDRLQKLYDDIIANKGTSAIAIGDFNSTTGRLLQVGFPKSVRLLLCSTYEETFYRKEIDHAFTWGVPVTGYKVLSEYGYTLSDHKPIIIEV